MSRWDTKQARIQIGQDLTTIEHTHHRLRAEAYHHADDPDIPGGTAMVMLGPRADIEAWTHIRTSADQGRLHYGTNDYRSDIEIDEILRNGIEPPLSFLAGWVDRIRDDRNQAPGPTHTTVPTEANYIRNSIDWILATNDNGTPWWQPAITFVDELHQVARALERLLAEDEQRDTGAPCLGDNCEGVRLVKHWAGTRTHPLPERYDYWTCPRCQRRYTVDEYRMACKQASRVHADRLTETDMLETYNIQPGTLRKWVQRGHVRKRGRDESGRTLYDVSDTLKQRDAGQLLEPSVTIGA